MLWALKSPGLRLSCPQQDMLYANKFLCFALSKTQAETTNNHAWVSLPRLPSNNEHIYDKEDICCVKEGFVNNGLLERWHGWWHLDSIQFLHLKTQLLRWKYLVLLPTISNPLLQLLFNVSSRLFSNLSSTSTAFKSECRKNQLSCRRFKFTYFVTQQPFHQLVRWNIFSWWALCCLYVARRWPVVF